MDPIKFLKLIETKKIEPADRKKVNQHLERITASRAIFLLILNTYTCPATTEEIHSSHGYSSPTHLALRMQADDMILVRSVPTDRKGRGSKTQNQYSLTDKGRDQATRIHQNLTTFISSLSAK